MSPASRQRQAAAFTLVELVISGALMSVILVAAYACLNAGASSQKLIETRAEATQSARVALALITADLRSACQLSKDYDLLGMHRMIGEIEADNLDFATHHYSPRRPREADYCQLSYFLEKDPATGEFTLFRRRNPALAPDPLAGGRREEIARGLRGLKFEYYDGFDWYDEWGDLDGRRRKQQSILDPPNLYGMPEAVRITLQFEVGTRPNPEAPAKPESVEPPLVFQTVARLNYPSRMQGGGSSGGGTNAAPAAMPGETQPTEMPFR
jgi:hypothetical protein